MTLIATVITMSSIAQLWDDEWEMVVISLQVSCNILGGFCGGTGLYFKE